MVWGDEYKCPPPWLAYNEKLKKKHWLKCPKAVTKKKTIWTRYKWFKISYLEFIFEKYYFGHTTFLYLSGRFLFISDFMAAGLKANKDLRKISLILRIPTHLTLKIICYHNIVKNLCHFTNFSANFCLVSEKAFTLHHFLTPKKCILKALWEKMSVLYLGKKTFVSQTK